MHVGHVGSTCLKEQGGEALSLEGVTVILGWAEQRPEGSGASEGSQKPGASPRTKRLV